jgi:hypothetical protein
LVHRPILKREIKGHEAEGFALQRTIDPQACTRRQVHQMPTRLIDQPKR